MQKIQKTTKHVPTCGLMGEIWSEIKARRMGNMEFIGLFQLPT
jgi:hypothetical protein